MHICKISIASNGFCEYLYEFGWAEKENFALKNNFKFSTKLKFCQTFKL